MSKIYMFLEMVRRRTIVDIYCITWNCAFSGTISNRIKGPRTGIYNRGFGLDNMEGINFTVKNSPRDFLLVASDIAAFNGVTKLLHVWDIIRNCEIVFIISLRNKVH